jgi:hypothetical protein
VSTVTPALLGRERLDDVVVLVFAADAREQVEDLARREHDVDGARSVRWTTTNTIHLVTFELDAVAGSDIDGYLARLAERGVNVVPVETGFRFR